MSRWSAACWAACAAVLASTAWHLAANQTPPAFDDAWYLEVSFRLFYALKRGLVPFFQEYASAFGTKAPLIALVPLPLYTLFGAAERTAAWANVPLLLLTWIAVHGIGRRLYGEKAAAAAAAACALTPLLYGLSRLFFVECLLTALVCVSVWAVLAAEPRETRWGGRLGVLLGLGLLAKSLYPLYLLGPAWARRRELKPHARRAVLVGTLLALSWYAFNAAGAAAFGFSAGFGKVARDYGAALTAYGESLGRDALSWPGLAALALLFAAAWRRRPSGWRLGPAERLLLSWLLLPLGVFVLGVNKDIRYMAPALPALALLAGAAAARAGRLPGLAALALGAWAFCAQTFGTPGLGPLAYNGPPGRDAGYDRAALVEAAARAGCGEPPVAAVAFEHPLLNANSLSSLAAARGLPLRFVNLGYAQPSVEGALIRLKDKGAGCIVLVDGELPPDLPPFLNRANEGIKERARFGGLPSRRAALVPLGGGLTAELRALEPRE